ARAGAGRVRGCRGVTGMFKRVGVVGSGLMGSGIAEVCARAGYQVVVREVSEELLRTGLARIDGSMERGVGRGKLSAADRDAARARSEERRVGKECRSRCAAEQ